MEAVVLVLFDLDMWLVVWCGHEKCLTYTLGAEYIAQCVGIISNDPASIDQAHSFWGRLGGHGILYATPQLLDRGGCGEVWESYAAFHFRRWREDPQVDGGALFGHGDRERVDTRVVVQVSIVIDCTGAAGVVFVYVAFVARVQRRSVSGSVPAINGSELQCCIYSSGYVAAADEQISRFLNPNYGRAT
jgi:hypothetical protein